MARVRLRQLLKAFGWIGLTGLGAGRSVYFHDATVVKRPWMTNHEFNQDLTLLHWLAIIHQQFFHNAAGFRLNVDLGDGLDFSGSYNILGQVTAFHLGQLRWINAAAATGCRHSPNHD